LAKRCCSRGGEYRAIAAPVVAIDSFGKPPVAI